jgi:hypothetical protein
MLATAAKSKKRSNARAKTTSRRAEANRRNSLKSTGPRTPEGKDKSRHNAVTHRLTARSGLLPGEDADESIRMSWPDRTGRSNRAGRRSRMNVTRIPAFSNHGPRNS